MTIYTTIATITGVVIRNMKWICQAAELGHLDAIKFLNYDSYGGGFDDDYDIINDALEGNPEYGWNID